FAPQGVEAAAKTPTVNEWNLTVEQRIAESMAIRAAYSGSFGYHGLLSIDPNSVPALTCTDASGCTAGGIGTARATVGQNVRYNPPAGQVRIPICRMVSSGTRKETAATTPFNWN